MKIYLFVLALVAAAMSDTNIPIEELLKHANDQFTAKFFTEVSKSQADKSFVVSAFSVLPPLAQLAQASVGSSHDEILTAIGMPNDTATKDVFSVLHSRLRSVKGVELKLATKVYVRSGYTLNDKFATISRDVFGSDVQNINFKNKQGAADEINIWVEDHTNKRIKNLVDPATINNRTAAILVNAIVFKGNWHIPFEQHATSNREFFVTNTKKVTVPMMSQTSYFKYGESNELQAQFLEMVYEGGETFFVVVLPNKYDGIDSLVEKLKDPKAFSKGYNTMRNTNVKISLPKFKIETTTDLKDVLKKINIKKLFIEDQARLSNLIKGEDNLSVSDAIQKVFIEVGEKGTEAAAANKFGIALTTSVGSRPNYKTFDADHPFVFFLMERHNIVFSGVFRS